MEVESGGGVLSLYPKLGSKGDQPLNCSISLGMNNCYYICYICSFKLCLWHGRLVKRKCHHDRWEYVARYDLNGFVEDLPSMLVARQYHACGSHLRPDGTEVRQDLFSYLVE